MKPDWKAGDYVRFIDDTGLRPMLALTVGLSYKVYGVGHCFTVVHDEDGGLSELCHARFEKVDPTAPAQATPDTPSDPLADLVSELLKTSTDVANSVLAVYHDDLARLRTYRPALLGKDTRTTVEHAIAVDAMTRRFGIPQHA